MNTVCFHLKIMLRNLQRGGIYSAINIGGLAIGMAAAILILAWIYHEWSYDRFHAKEKQLYSVYTRQMVNGSLQCWDSTPKILGPTLQEDYPEIVRIARIWNHASLYANDEAKFKIMTCFTDPDFLTMFDFPLLPGNRETALDDPYSVILTEKAAIRLFGNDDPIGKTLRVDNRHTVAVVAVMKNFPDNTLFRHCEILAPMSFMKVQGWYDENWFSNTLQTFVELNPHARIDQVNESIRGIIRAHTTETHPEVFLYPLGKRHLYSKFENGVPAGGLVDILRLFAIIAGLILLIACINFTNLSTARSAKRAKEVGVRKVLGGKRWSLIVQFLGEAMTVSFIAGALALMLAMLVLPVFNMLMNQNIILNLTDGWLWLAGFGFVVLTGLLAGSYPAFYFSSLLPVKVLKGMTRKKQGLLSSRKILVVVQFTVATVLISSTLVVHRQIRFAQNRESGYDKEQLIYSRLDGDIVKNYELIKQEILNSGAATSVTRTFSPITQVMGSTWSVNWQGKDPNTRINFVFYSTDADWTKTVGASIIEGRDIDIYTFLTDSTAMLLNESAVKAMNIKHPIGETVSTQGIDWHVVGVVKDFILQSPYEPVEPMLISGPAGWFNTAHIKLNAHNRMSDNLDKLERVFRQFNPAYPFEYHFVDEDYARKFQEEQKMGSLATWFAGLTIFISCLGLFALVAYMAESRRKEIGIRKLLGASVSDVIILLSKEFIILVLVSITVATPIAWQAMEKWLANYPYRTNIPWWLFVVVGCISLGIALLTVGFQAFKAATENPVKAIKSE